MSSWEVAEGPEAIGSIKGMGQSSNAHGALG